MIEWWYSSSLDKQWKRDCKTRLVEQQKFSEVLQFQLFQLVNNTHYIIYFLLLCFLFCLSVYSHLTQWKTIEGILRSCAEYVGEKWQLEKVIGMLKMSRIIKIWWCCSVFSLKQQEKVERYLIWNYFLYCYWFDSEIH